MNDAWNYIKKAPLLKGFDVSDSNYIRLERFMFRLENLCRMNVSYNNITEIPPNIFDDMPEVEEVDFSFNRLYKINDGFTTTKLKKILLSNNRINYINSTTFVNQLHLEFLDLRHNGILRIF